MTPTRSSTKPAPAAAYSLLLRRLVALLEEARRASARTVNVIMTATYWQVGQHIVEFEQTGQRRAGYGEQLLDRLSTDLSKRFGRGFSVDHLELMRRFYSAYPLAQIAGTGSRKLLPAASSDISESPIRKSTAALLPANSESVIRKFTVVEWSQAFPLSWTHYVHLLRRSRSPEARAFYETEALRGGWSVRQLDRQMSTLFYAREHWTRPGENPPVGLILCSEQDHAVARYALAGLDNKILATEYRLALPSEKALIAELEQIRRALEIHQATRENRRRAKRPERRLNPERKP
jgi:hypothetical protein